MKIVLFYIKLIFKSCKFWWWFS